jgi:UDP-N-acetylglucosamine acyltransferase
MATKIDKRAIIEKGAKIDENVTIGPYAVIGPSVKIGSGCVIDAFAQVVGNTTVGKNNHIFSYAVIGNVPQDLKYKGEESFLIVGNNNTIREFVTMNVGTEKGSKTIVGNGNLIMAYSHIAHDCFIGNDNVLANCATLAGHVTIEDRVTVGGIVAIHQFCRLGILSMIGGCSKVVQDVPPYCVSDGHPSVVRSLNLIGLRRANFSQSSISLLKKAFKIMFFEDHPLARAKELVAKELSSSKEVEYLLKFISSSERGIGR